MTPQEKAQALKNALRVCRMADDRMAVSTPDRLLEAAIFYTRAHAGLRDAIAAVEAADPGD